MKRVLFVIRNMNLGGSITSLLNMLEMLKSNNYNVDLFVMEHTGIFLERAKKAANLIPENKLLALLICDAKRVKKDYGLIGVAYRAVLSILKKIVNQIKLREKVFEICAKKIKRYDVVISYQEDISTSFAAKISTKNRIAWVHTIYERFAENMSEQTVYERYSSYDKIVCVVGAGADAFKAGQPKLAQKVTVINNPINTDDIILKSKDKVKLPDCFKIVSLGRLSKEKQYQYCIEAASRLKNDGYAFKWYIIGGGQENDFLSSLVRKYSLEGVVELTGAMQNPYPVLANSNLLVISSAYEAQPMVANEALILGVPVVTTSYDSAYEVVKEGENGLICENSPSGVYDAIKTLFVNDELMSKLSNNAKTFVYDNKKVLEKTIELIYGENNE